MCSPPPLEGNRVMAGVIKMPKGPRAWEESGIRSGHTEFIHDELPLLKSFTSLAPPIYVLFLQHKKENKSQMLKWLKGEPKRI